jgi:hypothetical protein
LLADWLELKAIASLGGRVGFNTLLSAVALGEDEQRTDIADENRAEDQLIQRVQDELERRRRSVGKDYPFRIISHGRVLRFVTPVSKPGAVYLFCLFLSHAFGSPFVSKKLAPKLTNSTRDLFQACATVAAGGYVRGPAVSFGWPRPEKSAFLKGLRDVYKKFGDGKPHKVPRPGAPKKVKDNGVDVIAWRRTADRLAGTQYLVAQVASGADWKDKSVKAEREQFHLFWFSEPPAAQCNDAMFMPFALEPEETNDGTPYADVLDGHMKFVMLKFGTLFYRDRVARSLADGLRCFARGERQIERVADLDRVMEWVAAYQKRLKAAAQKAA